MGVNANFSANFATFQTALDAAIVKLADFGKGAENVEKKLNDMVDKWSGRALIQQANELVIAIDKVGGATALTTTEQAKLNATLNEAIEKYHALGADVPPEMQKLADETKQASTSTNSWVGSLESLAGAFGIAFSVDALVRFGQQLFADATALNTLSQQTRIGVEDLQVLTAATADYGVTGEELGRALFNLQSRIAGGDSSVVHAYALMGISLDDLRGKDAKTLFLETERGLGTLSGALQDTAAKDLYGGKLGQSMVALSGGLDAAMEKTKNLNISTADSIKAMADYSDAINRTTTSFKNWVTEGIGGAILGIETLHQKFSQGGVVDDIKILGAGWLDWFNTQRTGVQHTEALTGVFDRLNQKTGENTKLLGDNTKAHVAAIPVLTEEEQHERYMTTLREQSSKALTDAQVRQLEELKAMNQLDAQHAEGIGVTVQQLEKYKAGLEAATKAEEEHKKAIAEADSILQDSYNKRIKSLEALTQQSLKAYSFDGQILQLENLKKAEEELAHSVYDHIESEKVRMKILEDLAAKRTAIDAQEATLRQKQAARVNEQVIAELDAKTKILAAYDQQADGTLKVENAQTRLQRSMDALHAKKIEGFSQYEQEQVLMDQFLKDQNAETDALDKGTEAKKRKNKATEEEITVEQKRAAAAMSTFSFAGGSELDPKFASMTTEAKRNAGYIDAYGKVTMLGQSVGFGYSAGGGRAAGGPVDAGTSYMVGERGPELFVPKQSGTIVPNGGGGTTVVANIYVNGTAADVARKVAAELLRTVKAGAQLAGA